MDLPEPQMMKYGMQNNLILGPQVAYAHTHGWDPTYLMCIVIVSKAIIFSSVLLNSQSRKLVQTKNGR